MDTYKNIHTHTQSLVLTYFKVCKCICEMGTNKCIMKSQFLLKFENRKPFSKLSCMEIPDESMGVLHDRSFQDFLYVSSIAL